MKTETFRLQNMSTPQDAQRVTSALRDVWGVRNVEIAQQTGVVQLTYDEQAASLQDFRQALADAGFQLEGQS
ncbi:heavy-metal-associated domain-containing protein [Brevibacillus fulvus]|uniref:Copper chaperone CopZ n=1 Tax=Brevibacillus fulvus TaxID=1125967 RepID=A0A938XWE6_9BACL|nr:heavy-metal-associated domain-containing protein [Brevibacillus fulvus]MBM7588913.1 copper chaperone CopZ [Brevibacillus fulvus]